LALSYHENGKVRSQTKVKDGKAYGLIEEWDENGTRLGQSFKNEFRVSQ
jgi:antitoxin component YwqK of YwqJK toxin-antitoxin module